MKEIFLAIVSAILKSSPGTRSRLSAYVWGPLIVISVTLSNVSGGPFSVDERPLSVTELRTEIVIEGTHVRREGAAFIIEPVASEYRVPLETSASRAWTSLDSNLLLANRSRLKIENNSFSVAPPLIGVSDPVMVVVDAKLGNTIEVPGGVRRVEAYVLENRSGALYVVYVVIALAFNFGLSLATGFASLNYKKHAAREV